MDSLRQILLVEDDPNDVELTLSSLADSQLANEVVVAGDGEQALDYLHRRGEHASRKAVNPAVILLDVKLPKVDGLEVLEEVKGSGELQSIPVVMLTSSREEQDLIESYSLGANAYVVKPVDFEEFVGAVQKVGLFWGVINNPPPQGARGKESHGS